MKDRSIVNRHQVAILSDRYLEVMLGDLSGTGLLLVQAPLIALAVVGVWRNISNDSPALYFVLTLSAFFFGAINSAREIVKERPLFLREKHFNLSPWAYLVSKLRVQAILVVIQCAILAGVTRAFIPISVSVFTLAALLIGVGLTGTALGLMVSSMVSKSDKAVAIVPLLVIPQILFSDFVVGPKLSNWTGRAQDLMPVDWGFAALRELRTTKPDWAVVLSAPMVLAAIVMVASLFAFWRLSKARY
jgi:ABC transport system ATP-binding/permease protein